jgi:hypothetical protein
MMPSFPVAGLMLAALFLAAAGVDIASATFLLLRESPEAENLVSQTLNSKRKPAG